MEFASSLAGRNFQIQWAVTAPDRTDLHALYKVNATIQRFPDGLGGANVLHNPLRFVFAKAHNVLLTNLEPDPSACARRQPALMKQRATL